MNEGIPDAAPQGKVRGGHIPLPGGHEKARLRVT